MNIRYRPRALADLESIFNDTYDRWGPDQADNYLKQIRAAVESLLDYPHRGHRYSALNYYRSIPSGRHLIFYTINPDHICVVRVLHDRMDLRSKLLEEPDDTV